MLLLVITSISTLVLCLLISIICSWDLDSESKYKNLIFEMRCYIRTLNFHTYIDTWGEKKIGRPKFTRRRTAEDVMGHYRTSLLGLPDLPCFTGDRAFHPPSTSFWDAAVQETTLYSAMQFTDMNVLYVIGLGQLKINWTFENTLHKLST